MKFRLTDDQWHKTLPFLQTCPNIYTGQENECRQFLEGVLWIAGSGAKKNTELKSFRQESRQLFDKDSSGGGRARQCFAVYTVRLR